VVEADLLLQNHCILLDNRDVLQPPPQLQLSLDEQEMPAAVAEEYTEVQDRALQPCMPGQW
jgi:hypothetical protein